MAIEKLNNLSSEGLVSNAVCKTNLSGYEGLLEIGKKYKVLDIQDAIFFGDYYVRVALENGKTAQTHLRRFKITKEEAEAHVVIKYGTVKERLAERKSWTNY